VDGPAARPGGSTGLLGGRPRRIDTGYAHVYACGDDGRGETGEQGGTDVTGEAAGGGVVAGNDVNGVDAARPAVDAGVHDTVQGAD